MHGARLQGDQLSKPAGQGKICQEHTHSISLTAATLQCRRAQHEHPQHEHPQQQSVNPHPPSVKQSGSLGLWGTLDKRAARRDTLRLLCEQTSPQSKHCCLPPEHASACAGVKEPRSKVRVCSSAPVFHLEKLLQDAPVGLLACSSCISQSHGSIFAFTLSDRTRSQWKPGTVQRCFASAGWSPAQPSQRVFQGLTLLSTVSDIHLSRLLISNHICDASDFRAFPKPP